MELKGYGNLSACLRALLAIPLLCVSARALCGTSPTVSIEAVACAGLVYPVSDPITLPRGSRNLRIDYTAPVVATGERMRFRYQLAGVDEGWRDVGQRRQAHYTDLAPGHYEFRVMASNGDGVWSANSAILRFDVTPALYRTIWFRLLCLSAFLFGVVIVFLVRFEIAQERYRQGVQERHLERERIARELHDTLLQGVQALLFRLQNWETDPTMPVPYRNEVSAVVKQVRSIVVEGRDRILMLRRTDAHPTDLVEGLRTIGNSQRGASTPDFRVCVLGEPRLLTSQAYEQLIEIGREAIRNAYQHARASRITVSLEYRRRSLQLTIADDGIGMDEFNRGQWEHAGHFGLVGMRERAVQLKAAFSIERNAAGGTTVSVRVPRRAAFKDASRCPWLSYL